MWVISSRTIQGVDYAHTPWPFSRICSSQGEGIHSSVLYSDVGLQEDLPSPVHEFPRLLSLGMDMHALTVDTFSHLAWEQGYV